MRSSDTPLPNPHPVVHNARLSLIDIPGLFTAPFSAHGLHCVPGCETFYLLGSKKIRCQLPAGEMRLVPLLTCDSLINAKHI